MLTLPGGFGLATLPNQSWRASFQGDGERYLCFNFDLTRAAGEFVTSGRQANFRIMEVIFFGRGSESLLADFDSVGIVYERWVPRPWQIMDAGFWARIDEDASWPAVSEVLVAWLRASGSRKISITQADHKILEIAGMSAEAVEKILPSCRNIMAVDRRQPGRESETP